MKNKKNNTLDVYRQIASQTFNVPYEDVTKEQRMEIKRKCWLSMYSNVPLDINLSDLKIQGD